MMFMQNAFWINECKSIDHGDHLEVLTPAQCDLFCALDGSLKKDAPIFGVKFKGDCRLKAKVSFQRSGDYDGAGLVLYADERHWVKICMEATDFGKIAIANLVTDGFSDDANGPNITADTVWLMIVRKGNAISMHYSLNGVDYEMVRISHVFFPEELTAAIIAQAPVSLGGPRYFSEIVFENISVENIRTGK